MGSGVKVSFKIAMLIILFEAAICGYFITGAAAVATPWEILRTDTKDELHSSGGGAAVLPPAQKSDAGFEKLITTLKYDTEEDYENCYTKLNSCSREALFVSEVFWEKLIEVFTGELKPELNHRLPVTNCLTGKEENVNIMQEIRLSFYRWHISDLENWRNGVFAPQLDGITERELEDKLNRTEKSSSLLIKSLWKTGRGVSENEAERLERVLELYASKKDRFISSVTRDRKVRLYQRLLTSERTLRILCRVQDGLLAQARFGNSPSALLRQNPND